MRPTLRPAPSPRRSARSGCTGPCGPTPSRSRSVCSPTPSPSSTAARPHASHFDELRERLGADAGELARGAARRLPARAADAARRRRCDVAMRAGRAADRVPRSRAGRPRSGPELTSLAYTTVRMEEPAARLLITLLDGTRDRAAIRAELPPAPAWSSPRPTSTTTCANSRGCFSCWRDTTRQDGAAGRLFPPGS